MSEAKIKAGNNPSQRKLNGCFFLKKSIDFGIKDKKLLQTHSMVITGIQYKVQPE